MEEHRENMIKYIETRVEEEALKIFISLTPYNYSAADIEKIKKTSYSFLNIKENYCCSFKNLVPLVIEFYRNSHSSHRLLPNNKTYKEEITDCVEYFIIHSNIVLPTNVYELIFKKDRII